MGLESPIYMSDIVIHNEKGEIDIEATRTAAKKLLGVRESSTGLEHGYIEATAIWDENNAAQKPRDEAITELQKKATDLEANVIYGLRIENIDDIYNVIAKGYCAKWELSED